MNGRQLLAGLLLTIFAQVLLASDRPALTPGEHWMAATVDHRDAGLTILVYQYGANEPLLRIIDLDQLALAFSSEEVFRHRGERYVLAGALSTHEIHFDRASRRVHFVSRVRPHRPDVPEELLLDVRVNDTLIDQPLYVRNTGSDLVLPKESLEQMRIALPDAYGPFLEESMPVHALAGELFHLAPERLYLEMTVQPKLFETTGVTPGANRQVGKITDWTPSAVIGYDLAGGEDAFGERWQSALADIAISSGSATCRSRHLYRTDLPEAARLDSNCIADWPSIPLSAGAGDHFSRSGAMGQTVAYGGFWIGTDFSLQPYRNLQPSLMVDGNARLPSTLEIWMDQRLGLRRDIPPGPFVVENLPAVTGSGRLRAELVDATGRQVLVSTKVYSDPRLLQPGVVDWRIEGGRLRPGSPLEQDDYTDRFTAAFARSGITDWLTGEVRAEATEEFSTWNVSGALRLWDIGLVELGMAASRTDFGDRGESRLFGYTYRGELLHVGFRTIRRTPNFVSLGYSEPGDAPLRESVASVGASAGPASLTLSGLERVAEDSEQRFGNASLSIRLGSIGQLLLTATRNFSAPGSEPLYGAHLSIPLGRRSNVYHSISGHGENARSRTGYSASPPPGSGTGIRLARDAYRGNEGYLAEVSFRGDAAVADVAAQVDTQSRTSWSARTSGALVASSAGIGLSRDDGDSFAVIETSPGTNGARVLREHQVVTTTGSSGKAIVPGLRPYQSNRIALNVEDLPMSSEVSLDEMTVVAGRRGVVSADFGYQQQRRLVARLTASAALKSGIPPGARIFIDGAPAGIAGYDGTIYVTLPAIDRVRIEARWDDDKCAAYVRIPPGNWIFEAGELTCHAL